MQTLCYAFYFSITAVRIEEKTARAVWRSASHWLKSVFYYRVPDLTSMLMLFNCTIESVEQPHLYVDQG